MKKQNQHKNNYALVIWFCLLIIGPHAFTVKIEKWRFWNTYRFLAITFGALIILKTKTTQQTEQKVCTPVQNQTSPAKVYTANNTPYFDNHLEKRPSPTETFVRNEGPRLHHRTLAVKDGERDGIENIDFVVNSIAEQGQGFLLDVIGSKEQGLKQIFSNASEHSSLIIEYVQR